MPKDWPYNFPWIVLAASLLLTGIGLLGIYSATLPSPRADTAPEASRVVIMQVLYLIVALGVFVAALVPSYLKLARFSYLIYVLSLLPLVLLLVAQHYGGIEGLIGDRNGAYSWFQVPIPGMNPRERPSVQPSELTKIAFIMALARYLTYSRKYRTLKGLAVPLAMALVPTLLVVRQPDLGTAMMFVPVLGLMLLAAGARIRHMAVLALVVLAMTPLAYLKFDTYQQRRLDVWIIAGPIEQFHMKRQQAAADNRELTDDEKREMADRLRRSKLTRLFLAADYAKWWSGRHVPWLFGSKYLRGKGYYDAPYEHEIYAQPGDSVGKQYNRVSQFVDKWLLGPGFHAWQAKVAVGHGHVTGTGLAQGSQTRHRYLAEAHNDFVFAVIAEEWGLIGALLVLALFMLIVIFGVDVGLATNEPYGKLLAIGVVALIGAQAFLNMAIAVGLTPITGIPLPLMSSGGSSLVSSYLALGLLCNVGLRRYLLPEPQPFQFDD
ncbi:MAG: FtsW/RodA/SpoVE family cell cycle protein [Planctomycetes bacterium]|nr:FtsW/RodA/SpoVE family cell cycle protein [Planctomycetota bacterium]